MKNKFNFLIYKSIEEDINVDALIQNENIWLTQKSMSELFGVDKSTISRHLKNIFEQKELNEEEVVAFFATTSEHGSAAGKTQTRDVKFYNLDAIISVGYRVNSLRATQFRIWATSILKEFMIKGFIVDDERLKQGKNAFGKDYFQELLETVRSIRASERRIWQKITDIFAECSIDYDKSSIVTKEFFATVQNKFHYAITGKTAAEIIYENANHKKPNMGLKTWKKAPNGRIILKDTKVAKNYLNEKEIKKLERTISSYFDYIEDLIERKTKFTMEDFANSINKFLDFMDYKILDHKGRVSKKDAEEKARIEYEIFNKTQKLESDFDKEVKKLVDKGGKEVE